MPNVSFRLKKKLYYLSGLLYKKMKKTSIGTSWIKMVSMKIDNDTRIRKVLTVYSQNDFFGDYVRAEIAGSGSFGWV